MKMPSAIVFWLEGSLNILVTADIEVHVNPQKQEERLPLPKLTPDTYETSLMINQNLNR
jgi:hypothetical protein